MNDNKTICGAKTRSGGQCQKPPVKGANRCKLHGGKTPRGTDSPHWKNGLYSQYASESLKDVLDELDNQSTDELNPEKEIRLMQALIIRSKALQNDLTDLDDLEVISRILSRLVASQQKSQQLMLEQQHLISVKEVNYLLDRLEEILIDRYGDEEAEQIINQLKNIKL